MTELSHVKFHFNNAGKSVVRPVIFTVVFAKPEQNAMPGALIMIQHVQENEHLKYYMPHGSCYFSLPNIKFARSYIESG
jgi:hypothetical protein